MKPTVALISIALLGGCATREGGVGSTIAGGAAIGVGALLIATDNSPACMDPPHCPFVAPVRFSFSSLAWLELALSTGAMLVGLLIMTALAGRIYRFGILKYGKKASWADAVKWIRA